MEINLNEKHENFRIRNISRESSLKQQHPYMQHAIARLHEVRAYCRFEARKGKAGNGLVFSLD